MKDDQQKKDASKKDGVKKDAAPSKNAPKASPKAAPAASSAAGGAVDDAAIKKIGDDIRELKEKLKAEGLSGKKVNDHADVKTLVTKLNELKAGA